MPRKSAKSVPGTERYRDEQREEGGPRMHGRQWHDHDAPHELPRESMTALDAAPDVESGGARTGMGARRTGARPSQTRQRRKRSVPPSKGPKTKAGAGKNVKSGQKGSRRA